MASTSAEEQPGLLRDVDAGGAGDLGGVLPTQSLAVWAPSSATPASAAGRWRAGDLEGPVLDHRRLELVGDGGDREDLFSTMQMMLLSIEAP
jgi:hypothetical protein